MSSIWWRLKKSRESVDDPILMVSNLQFPTIKIAHRLSELINTSNPAPTEQSFSSSYGGLSRRSVISSAFPMQHHPEMEYGLNYPSNRLPVKSTVNIFIWSTTPPAPLPPLGGVSGNISMPGRGVPSTEWLHEVLNNNNNNNIFITTTGYTDDDDDEVVGFKSTSPLLLFLWQGSMRAIKYDSPAASATAPLISSYTVKWSLVVCYPTAVMWFHRE